jgi:hypothetical protein
MLIKILSTRKCGPLNLLDNIFVSRSGDNILVNFNLIKDIENINPEIYNKILKNIVIKYDDIKNLSSDYGIVCVSLDFAYQNYYIESVTPKTLIERKEIDVYYNERFLLPFIIYFTPYKGCSFNECNILICCLNPVTSDIIFDNEANSTKGIMNDEYPYKCWGNDENYPQIISNSEAKIGDVIKFNITIPKNITLYLETNIGVLNKTKISETTEVEVDLSSIKDTSHNLTIKVNSKYWMGITKKTIKLIE